MTEALRQMVRQGVHQAGRWYSIPLLLLMWQFAVASGLVESRLLPSLGRVLSALATDIGNGILPYHAAITLSRAAIGFALAAIIGVPFAAAMARSAVVRNLFEPIFFLGYPVPKIALFPVFTYVFGIGSPSKIAFAFLECLYPIVVTAHLSFRAIPMPLLWTAENLGTPRPTLLCRVIFPAAMPGIFAGLRVALPISIVVIVLTEMIGDFQGPRLLSCHFRHPLRIRQRLCGDPGHRGLRLRARSSVAVASPQSRALGTTGLERRILTGDEDGRC